jgi:hypothetical protein
MSRITTEYFTGLLKTDVCTKLFEHLRDTIKWEEGIKSKKGHTRMAKNIDLYDNFVVLDVVLQTLNAMKTVSKNNLSNLVILGCYLNYYRNGNDWTPNHSHKGSVQIIISLGGERNLIIGKKTYPMKNGNVAIFGSAVHGISKTEKADPRISIALFCKCI